MTHTTHIETPAKAFFKETVYMPLVDAVGRISSTLISAYPPGIAIINIGTMISNSHVKKLRALHDRGVKIHGINMDGRAMIGVVSDEFPDYTIEFFDPHTVNTLIIQECTNLFRETFSNAPYNQFAYDKSDPQKIYSASELIFGRAAHKADYVDLDTMDKFLMPDRFIRFMDPDTCFDSLRDRFSDTGYLALLRERKTNTLKGFLHIRAASLRRVFETEEWRFPLLLSGNKSLRADAACFFDKMEYHFNLTSDDFVLSVSAQLIHPDLRGKNRLFADLMKKVAHHISPTHAALPGLTELSQTGTGRVLNEAVAERVVYGVLDNGNPLGFTARASSSIWYYEGPHKRFVHAVRTKIRENSLTYIPHRLDHTHIEVRKTDIGFGVFSTAPIKAGTIIAEFVGEKYQAQTAMALPEIMRNHALQIGEMEYVFAHRRLAELLNHSCDPNCGIQALTKIVAVQDIPTGQELRWDYRTTECSDWVLSPCLCGEERCTQTVGSFLDLPDEIRQEYLNKNMVSKWIREKFNL
ncbi:MAG TPA: SET domain-containing protein-lysine N-methyltransferase [Gammaproteobacteria bacterium]|nr:SET domain-containing protein-lysine N-methyltransferase [Gammaproteobacteria bacterium]